MFKIINLYLVIPLFLWIAHQILVINQINIEWLDYYLDDLVVLPILLGISLIAQQNFIANYSFIFHFKTIVFCIFYFSLAFEVIIPIFNQHYTSDWKDCGAYALGGIYFYYFQNKPKPIKYG
jgi:hypothetical protein